MSERRDTSRIGTDDLRRSAAEAHREARSQEEREALARAVRDRVDHLLGRAGDRSDSTRGSDADR